MADNVAWIAPAYDVSALFGALLVVYVMQKTEHDRINKVAPAWLQWIRRMSFIVMALLLCNSVLNQASRLSLVMLVWSGIGALLINAMALYLRTPPDNRPGRSVHVGDTFQKWATLRQLFSSFRKWE